MLMMLQHMHCSMHVCPFEVRTTKVTCYITPAPHLLDDVPDGVHKQRDVVASKQLLVGARLSVPAKAALNLVVACPHANRGVPGEAVHLLRHFCGNVL
jgi:hypothetical protein